MDVMINQLPELEVARNRNTTKHNNMTAPTQEKRNPYLSKWNTLFDNTTEQWISFQPKIGKIAYPCFSCRDMFANRNSFLDHVNRRGMVIKYFCFHCHDDMTFYNGCSFLLHARTHFSEKVGYIDLETVDISIISMDIAGFMPDPNFPRIFDVLDTPPDYTLNINVKFYKPKETTKGQRIVYFDSNDLIFYCTVRTNGIDELHSMMLKQISKDIPKCEFVPISQLNNPITITTEKSASQNNLEIETNHRNSTENDVSTEDDDILSIHSVHEEIICLSDEEKTENVTQKIQVKSMSKLKSASSSDEESLLQPMSHIQKSLDIPNQMPLCIECGQMQSEPMKNHFQQNDKPDNDDIKCTKCSLILPSECALRAHVRIHNQLAPYVCPECGKGFDIWARLLTHMEDVCFHLAKHVRYKCPARKCGKIFAQTQTFLAHFPMQHVLARYTCDVCGLTVLSYSEFQEHAEEHTITEALSVKSYDCRICSYSFDDIDEHVRYHCIRSENRIYVYTCKYCKSYYRSKNTYAAHLLRCAKLLSNSQVKKELDKQDVQCVVERFCKKCNTKIQFHCFYKDVKTVGRCCPQCSTDFSTIEKKTENKESNFMCILCNAHFANSTNHKCKYQKPIVVIKKLRLTPNGISSSDDFMKQKQKRKKSVSPIKNKKIKEEIEDFDVTPMVFEGEYICNLCNYKSESRENFHEHIKIHRDISTAYQCMECGECFVVKPSLAKHLQVFHLVEDVEKYFKENECFDKEAVKELEENVRLIPGESKGPLEKNQCRVCRQIFSDEQELSKHFRVHGMAFLMRNNYSK